MEYKNKAAWEACRKKRAETRLVLMDLLLENEGLLLQMSALLSDASVNLGLDTCPVCKLSVPAGCLFHMPPIKQSKKKIYWACGACAPILDPKNAEAYQTPQWKGFERFVHPLSHQERDKEDEQDEVFEEMYKAMGVLLKGIGEWEEQIKRNQFPDQFPKEETK